MPIAHHRFSLKDHNSFGIDVNTALYAAPNNDEELKDILKAYNFRDLPYLVMGEGSNILFSADFEGLILHPQIRGTKLLKKKREY